MSYFALKLGMSKERIVKFGRNGEAREAIELSEREGRVPNYKVNDAAVQNAEKLIRDGKVDSDTDWSDGQPSTDDENRFIVAVVFDEPVLVVS